MSLFKHLEKTASVYNHSDSDITKITTPGSTAAFTIKLYIKRRPEDEIEVLGEDTAEYVGRVDASYTNASSLEQGQKIVYESEVYEITNKPKHLPVIKQYLLLLRKQEA